MTHEVLNDRNQGATSLQNGALEFMIQRRTYRDDSRGVREALNETDPTRTDGKGLGVITKHYFIFYSDADRGAVRDILIRGGDTDTNAAIIGGLLGAR